MKVIILQNKIKIHVFLIQINLFREIIYIVIQFANVY
jgi:hypothetical protein